MIPDINLLPNIEKRAEGGKLLYVLLSVISVLALSVFVYMFISSLLQIKDLEQEQQTLTTQQTQLQTQLDSIQNMNAGSLEESLAFVERVSYAVSPLIDESKSLLPDNTYLRQYSFSADAVMISADFEMLSDVANYVEELNGSDYFSDVQVTDVTNFELDPAGDSAEKSQEQQDREKFQQLPRYTVSISLLIDAMYLANGGV